MSQQEKQLAATTSSLGLPAKVAKGKMQIKVKENKECFCHVTSQELRPVFCALSFTVAMHVTISGGRGLVMIADGRGESSVIVFMLES